MKSLFRIFKSRRAETTIEFAIVGVTFMLMSLGPVEYGRLMWTREAVQSAAAAGARCIGLRASGCSKSGTYDNATAVSYVQSQASNWQVTLSSTQISATNNGTSGACQGLAEVTISYPYAALMPRLFAALNVAPTITGFACFPNQ